MSFNKELCIEKFSDIPKHIRKELKNDLQVFNFVNILQLEKYNEILDYILDNIAASNNIRKNINSQIDQLYFTYSNIKRGCYKRLQTIKDVTNEIGNSDRKKNKTDIDVLFFTMYEFVKILKRCEYFYDNILFIV